MKNFLLYIILLIASLGLNCGQSIFNAEARVPDKASRQVEIYAKQFSWTIRYAGADNVLGASNYKLVTTTNPLGLDSTDVMSYDDVIVTDTFFLPADEAAELQLRSQDVIHSASLPHFRAQMNVVPDMSTFLMLMPEKTTKEMRTNLPDPAFDYVLLCNKICGAKHFEMKVKVVVGTREEFSKWMKRHKPFFDGKQLPQQMKETEGDGSEGK